MLYVNCQNIAGGWVAIAWAEGSDEVYRGLISSLKEAKEFETTVHNMWPEYKKPSLDVLYRKDIASLASAIPGIHQNVTHPETKQEGSLYHIIQELNDSHGWSREKIADWIETLDNPPKFEAPGTKIEEGINSRGQYMVYRFELTPKGEKDEW